MAYKTVYNNVIFIEGTDNRVNVKKEWNINMVLSDHN